MTGLRLSDPEASRAVLIGVHKYEHSADLPALPAVEHNLTGLADALADPRIWGLPRKHLPCVLQPSTASDLLDGVIDAGRQVTDTLLVYYAGHGLIDEDSDELYLALPRSRKSRPDTAFRYELLRRVVSKVAAERVVVILDCCWSGRAVLGAMAAGDALADLAAVPGRCVLTASAATQIAQAPPGETYTAFTGALLRLLAQGVPNQPDLLDMQTLYLQVRAELRAQSRPLPELGSRGSPGLICIARNLSEQAIRIPQPPPRLATPPTSTSRRPTGVPARMSALVRECLLRPPQSDRLYVVQDGLPESTQIRKARATHHLEQWEEIIAVWQWGKVMSLFSPTPNSLVFTGRGIRIADKSVRLDIPYSEFGKYTFSHGHSEYNGRQYSNSYDWLEIDGPKSWKSPGSDVFANRIADDLNCIKKLAAG